MESYFIKGYSIKRFIFLLYLKRFYPLLHLKGTAFIEWLKLRQTVKKRLQNLKKLVKFFTHFTFK